VPVLGGSVTVSFLATLRGLQTVSWESGCAHKGEEQASKEIEHVLTEGAWGGVSEVQVINKHRSAEDQQQAGACSY
jgi:hypothetical protein